MKNFLLKTKESSHHKSRWNEVHILLIWGVVLFVGIPLCSVLFNRFGGILFTPFYSVKHYLVTSTAPLPLFLKEKQELIDQITELQREISAREGLKNTVTFLTQENETLRHLGGNEAQSRLIADVISRPPSVPYDSFLINRGSRHGVQKGAAVYYGSDRVLGYVISVFERSAVVILLSAPNEEGTAYLFGPNIFAHTIGMGNGVIGVRIPQGIAVGTNTIAVMPVFGGDIIGLVSHIVSSPTDPEQIAYVTLDLSLESIKTVAVDLEVSESIPYEEAIQIIDAHDLRSAYISLPEDVSTSSLEFLNPGVGTSTP